MHISKKSSVTEEQEPLCAWGLVTTNRDLSRRYCLNCYDRMSSHQRQELKDTEFHAIVKKGAANEAVKCHGCSQELLILNSIKLCDLCREEYARHWKSVDEGHLIPVQDPKGRCNNWGFIHEPDFDEDEDENSTIEDNSDR